MATFNKAEQAIIDTIKIEENPSYILSFHKSGKVKDNNIRYMYRILVHFFCANLTNTRVVYESEYFDTINDAVFEAETNYKIQVENAIHNKKIYVDNLGNKCICGYTIYGSDSDLRIYISNEEHKLYSYPNGDVVIFINEEKVVLINDIQFYENFKQTALYREKYANTSHNSPNGCAFIVLIIIAAITAVGLV